MLKTSGDRKGNIWIATHEGVFQYDGKLFTNITREVAPPRVGDNKTWLTSNLSIKIPGSYGYQKMQCRKVIDMAVCIRGNLHRKDVSY